MKNLENLTNLKILNLYDNKITQIEGLDKLKHLRMLNL